MCSAGDRSVVYIATNPATGIKDIRRGRTCPTPTGHGRRGTGSGPRRLPAHMKPAIALMTFTGLGPRTRSRCRALLQGGEIATQRSKTGEPVFWPCPSPLTENLRPRLRMTRDPLANSNGRPWTLSGFRASWRPVRMKLEAQGKIGPGLTLYGLRHTVAVILREIGMRRAHDRRRARAEDDRDGPPLREERRSESQDAWRGPFVRGRTEQTKNESCQTGQLKVSNPTNRQSGEGRKEKNYLNNLNGRSGGSSNPQPPVLETGALAS